MTTDISQPQASDSVTQCPHCMTAFHIGLAQLRSAKGVVRCGNCLEAFNAKSHFLVEQKILFDDPQSSSTEQTDATALSTIDHSQTEDDGPIVLGNFDHHGGASIPRYEILSKKYSKKYRGQIQQGAAQPAEQRSDEISDISKRINARLEEKKKQLAQRRLQKLQENAEQTSKPTESANSNKKETTFKPEINAQTLATKLKKRELELESYFIAANKSKKISKRYGWVWCCLSLFLLLIAQIFFIPTKLLLDIGPFKQAHQLICAKIACPNLKTPSQNMVQINAFIEKHKTIKDSLSARIDLNNNGLPRPFPLISLTFFDDSNQVTASRLFKPLEYLKGEARQFKQMPSKRPLQITIEIVDPGSQSKRYEFAIVN